MESALLFYGGIAGMALALVGAAAAAIVFRLKGARLRARLDEEYGESRD
jgi:hypothetical protein